MFLKIASALAILGLLLSLLLSLIQQALFMGRFYSSSMQYLFRLLTIGEKLTLTVPLIVFFVAFVLSLNEKKSTTSSD